MDRTKNRRCPKYAPLRVKLQRPQAVASDDSGGDAHVRASCCQRWLWRCVQTASCQQGGDVRGKTHLKCDDTQEDVRVRRHGSGLGHNKLAHTSTRLSVFMLTVLKKACLQSTASLRKSMADGGLNRWLMPPPHSTCTCQQECPLCPPTEPRVYPGNVFHPHGTNGPTNSVTRPFFFNSSSTNILTSDSCDAALDSVHCD